MDEDDFEAFFNSWPRVLLNRNQSETEIFKKYFNSVNKNELLIQMINTTNDEIVKDIDEANKLRDVGNVFYIRREYERAIFVYNNSLCLSPRDSTEFGLAVANRSAALFDMEKYKECLEDINLVFKSEYPKDLLYKIYMRQSKCFLKLNNYFEAAKALRKAQEFVNKEKLTDLEKSSRNDKIKELKNELRKQLTKKSVNNETIEVDNNIISEPVLTDGENPNFLNASNIVEYRKTKKRGRHVVAKTDIKKGDILFVEEPYSYINNQKLLNLDICNTCLKRVLNIIPCTHCVKELYCSEDCRQKSWDLNHRWTCFGKKQKILTSNEQLLALDMLFTASRDGFQSIITNENVYGNKDNNFAFLNKLLTNKEQVSQYDLNRYAQVSVWMVKYLKNFTDYFDWLYFNPNRPEGSKEDLFTFVGGQLIKFFLQINCNQITIYENTLKYVPVKFEGLLFIPSGFGIYMSTALLNHSCVANTLESFHDTKIVVRAINDIKKGTEITRYYLKESYTTQTHLERLLELQPYSFICTCQACSDSNLLKKQTPFLCLKCGDKAYIHNQILVKCIQCNSIQYSLYYISNEEKIRKLYALFDEFKNKELLDEIYETLKKTSHKDSKAYLNLYATYLNNFKETGPIKRYLTFAKDYLDLFESIFNYIEQDYLLIMLNYVFCLTKYCVFLKMYHSDNYKKFYKKTMKAIERCEELMQYFFNPIIIKKVVDDLKTYLNLDTLEINDGAFMLEELD